MEDIKLTEGITIILRPTTQKKVRLLAKDIGISVNKLMNEIVQEYLLREKLWKKHYY